MHKGEVLLSKDTKIWHILEILYTSRSPLNVKALKEKAHLDYAYCDKRVRLLLRMGFVRIKEMRPGPKKRKLAFYDLSLLGLINYIWYSQTWQIDRAADKYKELLPHVFGQWQYFKEQDLHNFIIESVKKAFENIVKRQAELSPEDVNHEKKIMTPRKLIPSWSVIETNLLQEVEELILIPWIIPARIGFWPKEELGFEPEFYSEKYITTLRNNQQLWQFLKPIIERAYKNTKNLFDHLQHILKDG